MHDVLLLPSVWPSDATVHIHVCTLLDSLPTEVITGP